MFQAVSLEAESKQEHPARVASKEPEPRHLANQIALSPLVAELPERRRELERMRKLSEILQ